jgi:hypothetical protein
MKPCSGDTMIGRYLPEFRDDIHLIYHRQVMHDSIQDERNEYTALKNGTYKSRKLGEEKRSS